VACTPSATILRPGDVNDPMRAPKRASGIDEALPIFTGSWREDLGAFWATILLSCFVNVKTASAFQQCTWRKSARHLHLFANAARWTASLWCQRQLIRLAIIGFRMVVAITIIPGNTVRIFRSVPQVQVAIRMVVTIGFIVGGAPEPPRSLVCGHPRLMIVVAGIEDILGAATAAVLWASDINDPIRCTK